jgi:hypothetical protein
MLLTLGMLLAPLVLAVAVRLVIASRGDSLLLIVSLLVAAATLWRLSPGPPFLTSASWIGRYMGAIGRLLTALAAVQLAAPLAGSRRAGVALAALHAALLGLLGYGLSDFSGEWLRRLFVDRAADHLLRRRDAGLHRHGVVRSSDLDCGRTGCPPVIRDRF